MTIAANLLGSSFPYHTEPEFEITGGFVDGMGGIMSAAFAPLVKEEEREQWEAYSQQEQGWIENSKFLKEIHPVHRDALHGTIQDHEHDRQLEDTAQISKKIYRYIDGMEVVETTEPGKVYAPLWQVSPADYKPVNANLLADPRIAKLYEVAVKTKRAVLSENTEIGELVRPNGKLPCASTDLNRFSADSSFLLSA